MARTAKFTHAQIEEALRQGAGVYTVAALRLKCAPNTVKNYVERSAKLKAVCEEIVEMNLDVAESKLLAALSEGNLQAVMFFLRTKGRARGYGDKLEVSAKVKTATLDLRGATLEEVRAWSDWDAEDEPAPKRE